MKINIIKRIYRNVAGALFIINGRKPWGAGYSFYKYRKVREVLECGDFDPGNLPPGYGFRLDERVIEYPWLFSRLPEKDGLLLDAGSVLNFDFILSYKSLRSKKIHITTLAPEQDCFWRRGVSYVYEDLRNTCYRDNLFDWIVCLSTVEHMGMDNTLIYTDDPAKKENSPEGYLLAIKEFKRILKPRGVLYLSVPFGKHRNHGWFQVFDGEMVGRIISTFSPLSVVENYFKYEPEGWRAATREECKEAISYDMLIQKILDDDYTAASRAIVCLEMVK